MNLVCLIEYGMVIYNNNKGFSLIQTLVIVLVVSVAIYSIADSLLQSRKQVIFLEQKQDLANYASVLDRVLSANSSCDWQLNGASVTYPLDLSAVTSSHPGAMSHSIDKLYIGPDASSLPVFEIGQVIPFSNHQIKAASMKLVDIIPTSDFGYYAAKVEFEIDSSSLLRSVKDIVIPIKFKVNLNDDITAKRIESCCAASGCSPPAPDSLTSLINNTPQTVTLGCMADNNISNTCTRNILATTGLGLAGIPASSIHLLACSVDSYGDMGGNGPGIPVHTVTYNPSTTDLTIDISQAMIVIKVAIGAGSSVLPNSFSCP